MRGQSGSARGPSNANAVGPHAEDHLARRAAQGRARRQLDLVLGEAGAATLDARRHEVHRGRADERGDEQVARAAEEDLGDVALLDDAVAQDGHAVAQGHRLDLVVGDVDGRRAQPLVQARELGAHRGAQLGVEVRQRLVEQERPRLAHQRAADRDALALAARELRRAAAHQGLQAEHRRQLVHAPRHLLARRAALAQAEGEVLAHAHVRIQRVVLEDHRDVAVRRGDRGHVAVPDHDAPGARPSRARRSAAAASTCHSPTGRPGPSARRRRRPARRRSPPRPRRRTPW